MKIERRVGPGGVGGLTQADGLHPLLERLFLARGVRDPGQLDLRLSALASGRGLPGLEAAVDRLQQALEGGERLLVVGDFDADGATSSALAVSALTALGAAQVGYLVPDRFRFGYGLTPGIVEQARAYGPQCLITVDNGISSLEGVAAARALGWRVLVTDHHLPGAVLPEADAIVNPKLAGEQGPFANLAGVGVIFHVLAALRARLREAGWFQRRGIPEPRMADWLDLVALGTVADVVPLDHHNRVLVEQGLRRIRAGRCRPGITTLARIAGRDPARLTSTDLAFALGPRLNAAGRLDDMSLGIECLLADSEEAARIGAMELDGLNQERRDIEGGMQQDAERILAGLDQDALPPGLCLYDPEWHQGVVGILAARVKERHHRPVIAFARAESGELKGSARSIPGLHIRDVLDAVASRHPGLIQRFGGHAMAAGLSLEADRLEPFRTAFAAQVADCLGPTPPQPILYSDGPLEPGQRSLEVAELLRDAAPWGQGFPAPQFDNHFSVLDRRVLKERHLKLRLRDPLGGEVLDAIAFNVAEELLQQPFEALHAVYRLEVNEYRGIRAPQLLLEYLSPA